MANTTDKITDVRNGARPNSARVTVERSIAGTTLNCNSLTGWPTASKVHFVTYQIDTNNNPIDGTQLDCYGIVSGNDITNFTVIDGTDGGNSVGDVVEMLPTAAWAQDLADALLVSHDRTGALRSEIVAASNLASNSVSTAKIQDSAVTTAKLNDLAVTTGKLAASSVTSAKLAPSKTTDANGWTVYDFGSFKMYTFSEYQSKSVINGQRTAWSTYPLPYGKTYASIKQIGVAWDGTYGGHVVAGSEGGTGGFTVWVGNQYGDTPLIFSGYVTVTLVDI